MNCKYRRERNYVNNKLPEIEKALKEFGYSDDDIKKLKNNKTEEVNIIDFSYDTVADYLKWNELIKHKREKAKES